MKRIAIYLLICILIGLDSVCLAQSAGDEWIDGAPVLSEVGIDEFLAYFESDPEFVEFEEFFDKRGADFVSVSEQKGMEKVKTFYETYDEGYQLLSKFDQLVNSNLDRHNDETENFDEMLIMIFLPFWSMEIAYSSPLSENEDWATVEVQAAQTFSFFGGENVKAVKNAPYDYTVSYIQDGVRIVDHFKQNIETGAIQMLCYHDKELNEMFEYVPLGNGMYAWQTLSERMVMNWDGQQITECAYSSLNGEMKYTERDSIYRDAKRCNYKWVQQRDSFSTYISYRDDLLTISASGMFGGSIKTVEIPMEVSAPEPVTEAEIED